MGRARGIARLWWRGRRPLQTVGLIVAAVQLVGVVAEAPHLLAVAHGTCAEHGELVHLDPGPEHRAAIPAPDTVSRGPAAATEHGHQHCAVALGAASRKALRSIAALPPAVLASSHAAPPYLPDLVRSAEILHVAPKLSPPL